MRRWMAGLVLGVALTGLGCDDDAGGDGAGADGTAIEGAAPDLGAADAAVGLPDAGDVDAAPPDAGAPGPDAGLVDNFGVVESEGDPACDGLHPGHCIMPFPSDSFLASDASGRRLAFGAASLPANRQGLHMRPEVFAEYDGYGPSTPIMFTWPEATLSGQVPVFEPARSLEDDAPTVILDTVTGERVGHWIEYDHLTLDSDEPMFVIRAAEPLARDRRYVVALRGFVDVDDAVLPAFEGFRALRDRGASAVIGVHARRERFERDVFAPLEAAGVARGDLQLAWDFTTSSAESGKRLFTALRERMLDAIGEDGPEYRVDRVDDFGEDPVMAFMVWGHAQIPSFLEAPDAGRLRRLRRGPDGLPVAEGFEDVEFTIQVPRSALTAETPPAILQYGHGFLGAKREATNGWLREMANTDGLVILAADMQGMSTPDGAIWAANLASDPGTFPVFSEQPMQGVMNHLALMRMMTGRMAADPPEALRRADGSPIYDPTRRFYFGNSQGGTLGAVIMAHTTDIERGVLGVPGCCYPFLLQRSVVFANFTGLLRNLFDEPKEFSLVLGLLGTGFDRLDPMTWVDEVVATHRVLLHVAKEDAQVHNEVSFVLARGLGAKQMQPWVRPIWGLEAQGYPYEGNAVVEYDFGWPDNPDPLRPPPDEHDTHGVLRKTRAGQVQMIHFLETGEVIDTCEGQPCRFDPN